MSISKWQNCWKMQKFKMRHFGWISNNVSSLRSRFKKFQNSCWQLYMPYVLFWQGNKWWVKKPHDHSNIPLNPICLDVSLEQSKLISNSSSWDISFAFTHARLKTWQSWLCLKHPWEENKKKKRKGRLMIFCTQRKILLNHQPIRRHIKVVAQKTDFLPSNQINVVHR